LTADGPTVATRCGCGNCSFWRRVWLCSARLHPATAATFQQMPATYNRSGVGPFTYFFRSTTPESHSWVAWKFSAEEFWHRCQRPSDVSFSNLPDGRYSIEITDDVNSDWYAARGQGSSGHTAPCRADPPPLPMVSVTRRTASTSIRWRHGSGRRGVVQSGREVLVSIDASDATTGVQSYRWTMGDGTVRTTAEPHLQHKYPAAGDWPASVAVTDFAGNQASASFTVSVPPDAAPASAVVGTPPQSTPSPKTAPPKTAPKATPKASCRKAIAAPARSKRAFSRLGGRTGGIQPQALREPPLRRRRGCFSPDGWLASGALSGFDVGPLRRRGSNPPYIAASRGVYWGL
jgi:hypothetical protein